MKKFLLLCLCLVGCPASPPSVIDGQHLSQEHKSMGVDNHIYWTCNQEDANESLVWVVCDFRNLSAESGRVCLDVSYNNNGKSVSNHRAVCSSMLPPGQSFTNFAAFVNDKHQNE